MSESAVAEREIILPVNEVPQTDLTMSRAPEQVLEEARRAAKALVSVIESKKKVVKINGELYPEFEDWQTLGKFYGLAAKVSETSLINIDDARGWEAKAAVVQIATGREISTAWSMCLSDEPRWGNRPLFQLRSMAQTRACAKALRNVLGWVLVLAGCNPDPAEEMDGVGQKRTDPPPANLASKAQCEAIRSAPLDDTEFWKIAKACGVTNLKKMTSDQADSILAKMEEMAPAESKEPETPPNVNPDTGELFPTPEPEAEPEPSGETPGRDGMLKEIGQLCKAQVEKPQIRERLFSQYLDDNFDGAKSTDDLTDDNVKEALLYLKNHGLK